ncbi:MAG: Gfo/Idh/MocA family oxidoreductase [Thermoguttaceae bacterium]
MSNRRTFLRQAAGGVACLAAPGIVASGSTLGANDRIRFGLIGAGGRGKEIFQVALHCPNAEAVAVADIYARRLDEVQAIAPAIKTYNDYRRLLDDKSIDVPAMPSACGRRLPDRGAWCRWACR